MDVIFPDIEKNGLRKLKNSMLLIDISLKIRLNERIKLV